MATRSRRVIVRPELIDNRYRDPGARAGLQDVELRTPRGEPVRLSNTENVDAPVVRASAGA